jgi:hypothetical protein
MALTPHSRSLQAVKAQRPFVIVSLGHITSISATTPLGLFLADKLINDIVDLGMLVRGRLESWKRPHQLPKAAKSTTLRQYFAHQ